MSIQNAQGGSISDFWTQISLPKAVSVPPSELHFRAFRGGCICWTFGSPRRTSCTLCYTQYRWQHLCLTFIATSHCKPLFSVALKFPRVFWCVCPQVRFSVSLFLLSASGKVRTQGLRQHLLHPHSPLKPETYLARPDACSIRSALAILCNYWCISEQSSFCVVCVKC